MYLSFVHTHAHIFQKTQKKKYSARAACLLNSFADLHMSVRVYYMDTQPIHFEYIGCPLTLCPGKMNLKLQLNSFEISTFKIQFEIKSMNCFKMKTTLLSFGHEFVVLTLEQLVVHSSRCFFVWSFKSSLVTV